MVLSSLTALDAQSARGEFAWWDFQPDADCNRHTSVLKRECYSYRVLRCTEQHLLWILIDQLEEDELQERSNGLRKSLRTLQQNTNAIRIIRICMEKMQITEGGSEYNTRSSWSVESASQTCSSCWCGSSPASPASPGGPFGEGRGLSATPCSAPCLCQAIGGARHAWYSRLSPAPATPLCPSSEGGGRRHRFVGSSESLSGSFLQDTDGGAGGARCRETKTSAAV